MAILIEGHDVRDEFYRFQMGEFQCVAVCDGGAQYSLESMVANAPRSEVESYLSAHGRSTQMIVTPYTYLYVDTDKHKILVDMGAGNLFPTTGRLLQNLHRAGITPDSIDTVFISHAHPDHVGGALDDHGKLNFKNATYYLWQKEWDFWFSDQAVAQVAESFITFARQKLTPLQEKMVLVDTEDEILPGVKMIFAPGHTPGHVVVAFSSEGKGLLYTADTVLHPLHLERPDWIPVFDIQPPLAQISKQHIFDLAATTKSLVLGQHFPPFPNVGHILRNEVGWKWQPIQKEQM